MVLPASGESKLDNLTLKHHSYYNVNITALSAGKAAELPVRGP